MRLKCLRLVVSMFEFVLWEATKMFLLLEKCVVMFKCIVCNRKVTQRQHAVSCDVRDRWQQRVCETEENPNIFIIHEIF